MTRLEWLGPGEDPKWTIVANYPFRFVADAIAVDPGKVTGIAFRYGEYVVLQALDPINALSAIRGAMCGMTALTVERSPANVRVYDRTPFEVYGALEYLFGKLKEQPPSILKAARKWWKVPKGTIRTQHERDALSHLVYRAVMDRADGSDSNCQALHANE